MTSNGAVLSFEGRYFLKYFAELSFFSELQSTSYFFSAKRAFILLFLVKFTFVNTQMKMDIQRETVL